MEDNIFFVHLFRFYGKCLGFPYTELGLELQHLFRQMEVSSQNELDEQLAAHCLDILNNFQGQEMSALQAEYARLFSHIEGEDASVSILFQDYGNPGNADAILEEIYDSLMDITFDESPDSMINFLDYYSYLSESGGITEKLSAFVDIVQPFSQKLFTSSGIYFYKETAKGLEELCDIFAE
jgi:nitrate reductase assembly molybdenum cofactor insertion protein NarJ